MSLFKRYQRWHCNTAIKAYTVIGKVLSSQIVYAAAHTLKDERAHEAIRTLVLHPDNKIIPTSLKDFEGSLERATEYNEKWLEIWTEHALDHAALIAQPEG